MTSWQAIETGQTGHTRAHRWASALLLACAALLMVACGSTAATDQFPGDNATTPSARVSAAQSPVASPSATLSAPPYAFPSQWLPVAGAPANVTRIVFSPSSPATGYLCADPSASAVSSRSAIYRTGDGGASWGAVSVPFSAAGLCNVAVDQTNPNDLFAMETPTPAASNPAAEQEVWRSQDGGATWTRLTVPQAANLPPLGITDIAVVGTRLLASASPMGESSPQPSDIYASADGGQTWVNVATNLHDPNVNATLQAGVLMWTMGTTVVIGASPPCVGGCGEAQSPAQRWGDSPLAMAQPASSLTATYYFRSVDGGQSWSEMTSIPQNTTSLSFGLASDGTHYDALAQTFTGTIDGGVETLWLSTDSGTTWQPLPTLEGVEGGYPALDSLGTFGMIVLPDATVLADTYHASPQSADAEAGIFRLTNGSTQWLPFVYAGEAINGWQVGQVANGGWEVFGLSQDDALISVAVPPGS